MAKKILLKSVKFALILFLVGMVILLATAFDVTLNDKVEYPWFTNTLAGITLMGFSFLVIVSFLSLRDKRRKNKKR